MDDGLGPALAERLGQLGVPGITVDADYQLTIEDAASVAAHDVVIFADASVSVPPPFEFKAVEPADHLSFSSHSLEPAAVLALARQMFDAKTKAFTLAIRGYEFEQFGENLTAAAERNLEAAVAFLKLWISACATVASIRGNQEQEDATPTVTLKLSPENLN